MDLRLPLIRKVIDLNGRILSVDIRIWHPLIAKTLSEAPWTLMPGSFRCANGVQASQSRGLHDGQIWNGLRALLPPTTGIATGPMLIHPIFAEALQQGRFTAHYAAQLKRAFCQSDGSIVCIFEANGHWTLLWGCPTPDGFLWQHYDGISSNCAPAANSLALLLADFLGLDFSPVQPRCSIPQLDAHTCGTIALAHLFQILNPGFMVPPRAIGWIHD